MTDFHRSKSFKWNVWTFNLFLNIGSRFKVQGFFICHIINYTGYNQKWNVIKSGPLSGQCRRIKTNNYIKVKSWCIQDFLRTSYLRVRKSGVFKLLWSVQDGIEASFRHGIIKYNIYIIILKKILTIASLYFTILTFITLGSKLTIASYKVRIVKYKLAIVIK